MKKIPFLIIFVFINLFASDLKKSDLFKVANKKNSSVLFVHTKVNPKVIKNGINVSLVFFNSDFVRDGIIPFDAKKDSALKRIKIKNYKEKGGSINLIVKKDAKFNVKRISPDVVKISIKSDKDVPKIVVKNKKAKKIETKTVPVLKQKSLKPKKENNGLKKKPKKEFKLSGVVEKNQAKTEKSKKNQKKDNIPFFLDKKESKSVEKTDNMMKIYALIFLFIGMSALLFYYKKRGRNFINNNTSLMKIVEALPLGLKEKLVLLDVAGNYVLLFIKDKDVKELTMFSGEKAQSIRNILEQKEEEEDIFKDFDDEKIKTFPKKKSEKKTVSFSSKLSQILANEEKSRTTESTDLSYEDDLESELYNTISKLKKMRIS